MHMHLYKRDWRLHLPVADAVFQQKIQFNSIYLLIRQTCWHTTMLHKMKS